VSIHREIQAYLTDSQSEHHRYRSWEHCYRYFRQLGQTRLHEDRDLASLQLGFYLASWGMYRGSSFLLQHTYTIHRGVIDVVADPLFRRLWERDFGANESDESLVPTVLDLVDRIRNAYYPFASNVGKGRPTDTLVTKVILGSVGCLPACDEFFVKGFRAHGQKYSELNGLFVARVLRFSQEHLEELQNVQTEIEERLGLRYPLMKIIDMYFWQLGFELSPGQSD